MNDCVIKPFTLAALVRCFETWCGPGQAAAPPSAEEVPAALPAPEQPEGAPLDRQVLIDIAEMGGAGGRQMLEKIFELFRVNAPHNIAAIRGAIESGPAKAVSSAAHALKSMCSNTGALPLAALCAELEKNAMDWPVEAATSHLAMIEAELARVQEAMQDEANLDAIAA